MTTDPRTASHRTLHIGNAHADAARFRGWFVGDLVAWAGEEGERFAHSARQSPHVQVKWYVHPPGDRRAEWSALDDSWSLSVVIDGDLTIDFEHTGGAKERAVLADRGAYAIWDGGAYRHRWWSQQGATVLTVRWHEAPRASERHAQRGHGAE